MWYGWHFNHRLGIWDRVCEDGDRVRCARKLGKIHPRPRTNLHLSRSNGAGRSSRSAPTRPGHPTR